VLFVSIPASRLHLRGDVLSVVTAIHDPLRCLPITAALEPPCIVAIPVVPDPPAIDVIDIGSMAMAIKIMDCATLVAGCKVAVWETVSHTRHAMIWLIKDPTEPSLPITINWPIHVCS